MKKLYLTAAAAIIAISGSAYAADCSKQEKEYNDAKEAADNYKKEYLAKKKMGDVPAHMGKEIRRLNEVALDAEDAFERCKQ